MDPDRGQKRDAICWEYDGSPEDCWNAEITGDQVKWMKDGKLLGAGTILKSNRSNF